MMREKHKIHIFIIMLVLSMFICSCMLNVVGSRPATIAGVQVANLTIHDSGTVITQVGDTVDFTYIGTYDNGTIFDRNTLVSQTIGNNELLPYFDQNLRDREAGVPFSFAIPPDEGYQTGPYAGLTLHFNVTITKVVRDGQLIYHNDLSITSPPDITYIHGTTGNSISWTITTTSSGTNGYIVYRNGTSVATGSWTSGKPVTISIDGLAIGIFNFTINANDTLGGLVQDTVVVTVSGGITAGYPVAVLALITIVSVLVLFKRRNWTMVS